ncbi:YecA family protein [Chondromyces crocatus]|uniref:Uncharacterized protein n=1 Tax=Chondromyces crocatus TaxID=52 RepID=A0A0K1ES93_CHOCO|nr:SEC-C metal-binding domain-containing protein [Chondromyces crocatus]AKT43659.1 uncharacterized protein CMC5_078940 [Chondromyces crocatus]
MPQPQRAAGHQAHFLTRLDRLSLPQVELALQLYRDPEVVRALLDHLTLPDAIRVALSLDDPTAGPFLLVTRDGRFVTCLAQGMHPGRCPVVTRVQLDAAIARHGILQQRLDEYRRLEGGTLRRILHRIFEGGSAVSREDIAAVSSLAPLCVSTLVQLQLDATGDLIDTLPTLVSLFSRTDRPRPTTHELLRSYWSTAWMSAHLAVLLGVSARPFLERIPPEELLRFGTAFSSGPFLTTTMASTTRGVWSVARIGKVLLPSYKRAHHASDTTTGYLETTVALALLGFRHARLHNETRKAIHALPPFYAQFPPGAPQRRWAQGIINACALLDENPDGSSERHLKFGREHAVRITSHLPPGSPHRFERPEDVPADIALAVITNTGNDLLQEHAAMVVFFALLPWLSRATATDLYLPRAFLDAIVDPWTPAQTLHLLLPHLKARREQAKIDAARPSRSGPCPCGSGKKHKRCCLIEA